MRRIIYAAGVILAALAIAAIAVLWASASDLIERVDRVEDRVAAVEDRPAAPPVAEWTVLSRQGPTVRIIGQNGILEACITYTSPAGVQERCEALRLNNAPPTDLQRERSQCWQQARIGEPLPDCWR